MLDVIALKEYNMAIKISCTDILYVGACDRNTRKMVAEPSSRHCKPSRFCVVFYRIKNKEVALKVWNSLTFTIAKHFRLIIAT